MIMGDTDKNVEIQHTKAKSKKSAAAEQVAKMRQAALSVAPVPAPVELVMMPVSLIDCAAQVRTLFDDASLAELAADIARRGVIQPILLRPVTDGRFRLIAGERRLRACILAQLPTIPAIVGQIDDEGAEDMQLAENIQREDLNLVDTAAAVKRLYEKLGNVQAVAEKCHKSKAWISKHLAIADGLNHYAAKLLADGVTEDLETLKAVSDLEQITPGTNTAWALCEKIRSGKAGRTAARETLAEAKDAADPVKREKRRKEQEKRENEERTRYNAELDKQNKEHQADKKAKFLADPKMILEFIENELVRDESRHLAEILHSFPKDTTNMLTNHLLTFHSAGIGAPYYLLLRMHCTYTHTASEMAAYMSGMAGEAFDMVSLVLTARDALKPRGN